MKRLIASCICMLLLAGVSAMAQDLTGTWIISNTVIKKTVDDNSTTQSYSANAQTDSYVKCPRKIIFSGNQITFEYRDGTQEAGQFELQGDKLIRRIPTANLEYKFKLNGNLLQLDYSLSYVIDGVHKAKEECSFYGYKE